MPKVSIIIPNWNGRQYLKKCFESLKRQTFRNFEVILVDNGSTDGSQEFVAKNFPEARVIKLDKNYAFAKAVNTGIRQSQAEYIVLLNNDTEVTSKWLEELVNTLETRPEIGFATSKILLSQDHSIINDVGDSFSFYGIAHQRGYGQVDQGQYDRPKMVFGACAAASIYRREVFEKVGLFDEHFFAYLEDIDFSFRAQLTGVKCLYLPEAVVFHEDRGTSKKIPGFCRFLVLRNSIYVVVKNMPLILIIKQFPKFILGQLRIFMAGIKHKCPQLVIKIYWHVLKNLPRLLLQRRQIQKKRVASIKYLESIISSRYPFSIKKSLKEMF